MTRERPEFLIFSMKILAKRKPPAMVYRIHANHSSRRFIFWNIERQPARFAQQLISWFSEIGANLFDMIQDKLIRYTWDVYVKDNVLHVYAVPRNLGVYRCEAENYKENKTTICPIFTTNICKYANLFNNLPALPEVETYTEQEQKL